jgi:hypothetical protein
MMIFLDSGFNNSSENADVKTLSIHPALLTALKIFKDETCKRLFTNQDVTPYYAITALIYS